MEVPPFKSAVMDYMPYVGVLADSESEAAAFASPRVGLTDVENRVQGVHAARPRAPTRSTRGLHPGHDLIVAKDGAVLGEFPAIPLSIEASWTPTARATR